MSSRSTLSRPLAYIVVVFLLLVGGMALGGAQVVAQPIGTVPGGASPVLGVTGSGPGIPSPVPGIPSQPPQSLGEASAAQTEECRGEHPDIGVKNVSTGPIYPERGETVSTRVTLENLGHVSGDFEVVLYLDRDVRTRRTVTVPGCDLSSTAFEYVFEEPGNHTVGIRWDGDYAKVADIGVGSDEVPPGTTSIPSSGLGTDPSTLDFGGTEVGETRTETVTVTNEGGDPLPDVRAVVPSGPNDTDFAVLDGGARTLEPGESRDVRVRFRPGEPGRSVASLQFLNASGDRLATVGLRGNSSGPDLEVEPESLSFLDAAVGERTARTLTVRNAGGRTVTVESLGLLGESEDFDVETAGDFSLLPGQERTLTVALTPTSPGPRSASLRLQPATEGVDDELVWLSTTRASAAVDVGQSPNRTSVTVSVTDAAPGEPVAVPVPTRNETTAAASLQELAVTPRVGGNFTLSATDGDTRLASSPVFGLGDGTTPLDFLSVHHSLRNSDVEAATLTVRVSKDRLAELDTRPAEVSLYRYDGTRWDVVSTDVQRETEAFVVVRASTDRLSEWTAAARRPRFTISEKSTSIDTGVVGDEVTIRVFVRNTGGADGVYVAELLLNDAVVDEREATIPEGGKRALNFERSLDQPGTYEVQVNDVFVGTVDISEPGDGTGGVDVGTDAAGTTTGSAAAGGDGGIPLAPIVLIGGALALLAAYMRYSGRPPGTVPKEPPEFAKEPPQSGSGAGQQQPRNAESSDGGGGGREGGGGGSDSSHDERRTD